MITLADHLQMSPAMVAAEKILDCNQLHRQLDYAQPFAVLLLHTKTAADVKVTGRFRVRHTHG
jgi:hypothetical protein